MSDPLSEVHLRKLKVISEKEETDDMDALAVLAALPRLLAQLAAADAAHAALKAEYAAVNGDLAAAEAENGRLKALLQEARGFIGIRLEPWHPLCVRIDDALAEPPLAEQPVTP